MENEARSLADKLRSQKDKNSEKINAETETLVDVRIALGQFWSGLGWILSKLSPFWAIFWVKMLIFLDGHYFQGKFMVWEKNLVPTEDDMKEIEEREYEFEDASDMLARWICNGGEITDDIFEKAYKEINLILKLESLKKTISVFLTVITDKSDRY